MRGRAIVTVCVLGAVLTACTDRSSASPAPSGSRSAAVNLATASAADLIAEARRQASASAQFRATGVTRDRSGTTTVSLGYDGDNATGAMTTGGVTIELSRVNGYDFVAGPTAFWRSFLAEPTADVLGRLRGKWVSFTAKSTTFANFARLLDRTAYLSTFLVASPAATRAGQDTVAGVDCYVIKDRSGTLYLARDTGRLIKVVDSQSGSVTYDYQGVVIASPPADKDLLLDADLGLN